MLPSDPDSGTEADIDEVNPAPITHGSRVKRRRLAVSQPVLAEEELGCYDQWKQKILLQISEGKNDIQDLLSQLLELYIVTE